MARTCRQRRAGLHDARPAAHATTPTSFNRTVFHSDLGLCDFTAPGQTGSGTPWDSSPGLFGKFDPLTYRYLSAAGDERLDLSTPEWLMTFGARVVGGGPATTARDGRSLLELAPDANNPETSTADPERASRPPGIGPNRACWR